MTATDPTTVTHDQVRAALDLLGIGDYDSINLIEIEPGYGRGRVTRFRRNEDGHFFAVGKEAARTITTIGIDEGDPQ